MATEKESPDYFGQFLMKNYRDKALKTLEIVMNNQWRVEPLNEFQDFLQTLNQSQRKILFDGFQKMIDGALAVQISDEIHSEQFGEEGWIEKFSNYK